MLVIIHIKTSHFFNFITWSNVYYSNIIGMLSFVWPSKINPDSASHHWLVCTYWQQILKVARFILQPALAHFSQSMGMKLSILTFFLGLAAQTIAPQMFVAASCCATIRQCNLPYLPATLWINFQNFGRPPESIKQIIAASYLSYRPPTFCCRDNGCIRQCLTQSAATTTDC